MSDPWSPNAQMAGLRFSGVLALILSINFLYTIIAGVLEIYLPNAVVLSQTWFVHFPLLTVSLACIVMIRYLLKLKELKAGGWQSMLLIIKDEYALSVYRNGAAKSFIVIIHLSLVFFYLSLLQNNNAEVMRFLTPTTISATIMFCSALIFGWVVIRQLKEEEE